MTCSFQLTQQLENFDIFTPSKCFVCLSAPFPALFLFFFLATTGSFSLCKIFWLDIIFCYQSSTGISLTGSPTFGQYFCCLTKSQGITGLSLLSQVTSSRIVSLLFTLFFIPYQTLSIFLSVGRMILKLLETVLTARIVCPMAVQSSLPLSGTFLVILI